ncbi:CHC2 zinc finger domain-containing protein [uncultured Sphingomonas sp.]|uniref:DUF7146 domain-containing protein n=1 Tax=uncultured Sphingomonas sp. TaxID=158754 RepID=UPI0025E9D254|nr:CHC2 zinc finger domain-containing protein [uncultured Sphingomonas sp.]
MSIDRQRIDDLKRDHPLSAVVSQVTDLRPAGSQMVGLCPFHEEKRPSFYVNDSGGYYCHGCGASGGDVIHFIQAYHGVGFDGAIAMLAGSFHFRGRPPPAVPRVPPADDGASRAALKIWREAGSIVGTAAERYLARRQLPLGQLPALPALRFAMLRYPRLEGTHPALVAGFTDHDGKVVSIQRTYLRDDGMKLDAEKVKLNLGSPQGGAIRLGLGTSDIILCEGLETGLSILRELPAETVWAVGGAGRIETVELPTECRSVVIARDNDERGISSAERAKSAFDNRGIAAHIMSPPPEFKDFNDQLCGKNKS